MIEKEIEVVIFARKFKVDLPPHEREAGAEFEQKALDVIDEGLFDFPFAARICRAEEIEEVWILENLGRHV